MSFYFLKIFIYLFIFWLCWVFVAARRLSLVAASGGLCFFVVCGLLIAGASLVAEHGLLGTQASVVVAHRLSSCGSQAPEHRLSSCGARA